MSVTSQLKGRKKFNGKALRDLSTLEILLDQKLLWLQLIIKPCLA